MQSEEASLGVRYRAERSGLIGEARLGEVGRRVVDAVLSGFGILIWCIPALVIALAIKLDSPGPVIFKQTRVGRWGTQFTLYKFRSMRVGSCSGERQTEGIEDFRSYRYHTDGRDPRVTAVGRFLRASSLDELPQLFNVLKGDMSVVGPRPEVPEIVEQYLPEYHRRHEMRPGITGLAQVNGRSELTYHTAIMYDLDYVANHALWRDLVILLRTIGVVVTGRGAR